MRVYRKLLLLLLIIYTFVFNDSLAQESAAQATISVTGEVSKPLMLKARDISAMKHMEVKARDNDGKEHMYSGVLLSDILQQAGVTLGKQLRGENLAKFVLIKASDGYEAVFSLPEIDPEFTDRTILLANKADGKPLPPGTGPYRIIVPGEKKHARWVREVAAIQILFAKE